MSKVVAVVRTCLETQHPLKSQCNPAQDWDGGQTEAEPPMYTLARESSCNIKLQLQ